MNESKKCAIAHSSYLYSLNLLRLLHKMCLITEEEFVRIRQINSEHYGIDVYFA